LTRVERFAERWRRVGGLSVAAAAGTGAVSQLPAPREQIRHGGRTSQPARRGQVRLQPQPAETMTNAVMAGYRVGHLSPQVLDQMTGSEADHDGEGTPVMAVRVLPSL